MTLPAMTNVSRLLSLFAALFIVTAPAVQAQTPSTTVTNENGDVVFQSNADGGLLAPGEFGTGTIPTEGAGTRLMWYPAKAAFRAGAVKDILGGTDGTDGTEWNADNVGDYSTAFGANTTASGNVSTAMGSGTQASGLVSTAMGDETQASGYASTAMGEAAQAIGVASTAMGAFTIAATDRSLSIGEYNSSNLSADGTLFVVGNGSRTIPSDALVVDQSGDLTISGTLTENSDRRLKTQIQPLGRGVLASLSEIEPVRFQFKDERTHPSGPQIGLIAQQVQAQFPTLVSEGASGHLSVSYSKLTAVLLKGLQEQQAQIDSLSREVRSLQQVKQGQKQLAEQVAALQQTSNDRSQILPAGWSRAALLVLLVGAGSFAAGRRWEGTAS
jgi:hypothetical protein